MCITCLWIFSPVNIDNDEIRDTITSTVVPSPSKSSIPIFERASFVVIVPSLLPSELSFVLAAASDFDTVSSVVA